MSEDPREHDVGALTGRYSNCFQVGHNAFEVVIEAGQCYGEGDAARFHTRLVTSPAYARELLETLRAALERYEQTYGAIPQQD